MDYLDFKSAKCRDCYKCLRSCPVKAIKVENHQAKIITEKCILCGTCIAVCPQDAKVVHGEKEEVKKLLSSGGEVIASVAPSFISSFEKAGNFKRFRAALEKLGFSYAEETAVGANAVTNEYSRLLRTGKYENFITSACPAINRMIQIYYPKALKYLAPVASPMVAHARMLKERYPQAKIVFIGPCIAKKREGAESGIIDNVLTFEELDSLFAEKSVDLSVIEAESEDYNNKARYYPISRGIIKSFVELPEGYEYLAVDGVNRSFEVLEDIESLSGLFIEINCCEYACINGPCALTREGGALKANEKVRKFARNATEKSKPVVVEAVGISLEEERKPITVYQTMPGEREIRAILARTGKLTVEDELNCGACGYSTCREKAIAVANGYADIDMCIPYMRKRAESMSYEIIQNSPNGIIVMDYDFHISDANTIVRKILGMDNSDVKGRTAFDYFDVTEYMIALSEGKNVHKKRVYVPETKKYADLSVILLPEHKTLFGVYKDVTESVEYNNKFTQVRDETLQTTDEVIKKQMRVAQEIASLLGETTAETKVALLKLKKTLSQSGKEEE